MAEYSVKVNRPDGLVVEITGEDKDWVSAQLKELAPIWTTTADDAGQPKRSAKRNTPASQTAETGDANGDSGGRKRTRKAGSGGRAARDEAVATKLTEAARGKLAAYVAERQAAFDAQQPHQAAIIATFLKDELSINSLDENGLYTVYDVMGWRTPGRPRAVLDNARGRKGFFSVKGGTYALTHKGENYGRLDSVTKAE